LGEGRVMKFLARVFCVMLLSFSCAYGGRLGVASFNVRCKAYGGLTCLAKQVKAVTQLMKKYASGIDFWCLQELFSTEVNPLESLQQTGYRFVRDTKNSSSEFAIAYNSDNWELLDSRTVSSHTPHALNRSFISFSLLHISGYDNRNYKLSYERWLFITSNKNTTNELQRKAWTVQD